MLKTAIVAIAQFLLSSPIILALINALMILKAGNPGTFNYLFTGFILNLVILCAFLISLILIVARNKNLTKKAIATHLITGFFLLGAHFLVGSMLVETYKNTNYFQ